MCVCVKLAFYSEYKSYVKKNIFLSRTTFYLLIYLVVFFYVTSNIYYPDPIIEGYTIIVHAAAWQHVFMDT